MGEGQDSTGHPSTARVSVQEAADRLGTTVDAIRKRVQRDTIAHEKDPDGRVWILLDADRTRQGADQDSTGQRQDRERTALISAKDETIATLKEQLQAERQAHAEARRLLAAALERIPAIEAGSAGESEPSEDAETVEEAPEGAEPRSAQGEVRDELGAERARRQTAEERVADLEADAAYLEAELGAHGGGRESPQTVEEASDAEPRPTSGESSQGQARPRSWWRTRIGSIIGGCLVLVFVGLAGFVVTTLILR